MKEMAVAGLLAAVCLVVPVAALPLEPATAPKSEAEALRVARIGAALLVRLAERVEWPPEAFPEETSPFAICVVGDDPFKGALQAFNGRVSHGRSISIKNFSSARVLSYCPVLFVSDSELPRLGQIIEALSTSPVLTVSYMEGFCEAGGGIRLVRRTNSIGFEINPEAAERAGLKVDPSLLRLALKVKRH